jgi:hypothetical protein
MTVRRVVRMKLYGTGRATGRPSPGRRISTALLGTNLTLLFRKSSELNYDWVSEVENRYIGVRRDINSPRMSKNIINYHSLLECRPSSASESESFWSGMVLARSGKRNGAGVIAPRSMPALIRAVREVEHRRLPSPRRRPSLDGLSGPKADPPPSRRLNSKTPDGTGRHTRRRTPWNRRDGHGVQP